MVNGFFLYLPFFSCVCGRPCVYEFYGFLFTLYKLCRYDVYVCISYISYKLHPELVVVDSLLFISDLA